MKDLNVLLVEDNEINQFVTGNFLQKSGIEMALAKDGKEAMEMVASKEFHFVLMDIQMPVMDGFECTRKIRLIDDPYFKTLPIFAYSSSSMTDTREKALRYGMTDFVNKPLMKDDFKRKINKYVKKTALDTNNSGRRLFINFQLYTDGNPKSKWQLILLIMGNIMELIQSLHIAIDQNNPELFKKIAHKVRPTLSILNDDELMNVMEELQSNSLNHSQHQNIVVLFHRLCEGIIQALEEEQTTIIRKLPEK